MSAAAHHHEVMDQSGLPAVSVGEDFDMASLAKANPDQLSFAQEAPLAPVRATRRALTRGRRR